MRAVEMRDLNIFVVLPPTSITKRSRFSNIGD
jgi:hypothetical protein